ncbi:MAG TPA: hypothetical protein VGM13_13285 [Thermoanaerobaculia bacterium]|jgi:hypothetical protein
MPTRSRRPEEPDLNQLAARIVAEATETAPHVKNPAAVALGRLGGQKGGVARAKALSAKKRREIARKGALARWKRTED